MAKPSKQQIASVRSALHEIHAELLAWDPNVLVSFNDEAQKAQIIGRLSPLGWHYFADPSNDTADVKMVEFSLGVSSHTTTPPSVRRGGGRVRRVKLPAPLFGSFGIICALVGTITAVAALHTDYRMRSLEKTGTLTTGEIERTYFTTGRSGRTYYVSYRFVDARGISHESEDAYPFPDWNSLRYGAPISVIYLADDPERNNLTQRVRLVTDRSPEKEMTWIGVPWLIAGLCFLGYWARRRPS